jgi:hypothetical protein
MKVVKPILQLSICPCGHTVLKESIKLGHEYTIDLESIGPGDYYCGGCNTWQAVMLIDASQTNKKEMAFLPYDLFVAETIN